MPPETEGLVHYALLFLAAVHLFDKHHATHKTPCLPAEGLENYLYSISPFSLHWNVIFRDKPIDLCVLICLLENVPG